MRNQDWYDLGDKVQNLVQDAINSKDFRQLNENITRTLDRAVRDGGEVLRNVFGQEFEERSRGRGYTRRTVRRPAQPEQGETLRLSFSLGCRECYIPEPAVQRPRELWKLWQELCFWLSEALRLWEYWWLFLADCRREAVWSSVWSCCWSQAREDLYCRGD